MAKKYRINEFIDGHKCNLGVESFDSLEEAEGRVTELSRDTGHRYAIDWDDLLADIQAEVDAFNEQHTLYEEITADPTKVALKHADDVIEEQRDLFVHFVLGGKEYQITYRQENKGLWRANLAEYKCEGEDEQ